MKLIAVSMNRYNGGVRAKRKYGSSTLTEFIVFLPEDEHIPENWITVKDVGGKTPGERATKAKGIALPQIQARLDSK